MKKINFRNTLFAAVLLFQLNAVAASGQTVVKGSVKDNTGKTRQRCSGDGRGTFQYD